MSTSFFLNQIFRVLPGYPGKHPGIFGQKDRLPWVSRHIPNFSTPSPSRGRPPNPHPTNRDFPEEFLQKIPEGRHALRVFPGIPLERTAQTLVFKAFEASRTFLEFSPEGYPHSKVGIRAGACLTLGCFLDGGYGKSASNSKLNRTIHCNSGAEGPETATSNILLTMLMLRKTWLLLNRKTARKKTK